MSLLAGQTAAVTGGAQGLGLAIAQRFISEGARVVLGDLNLEATEAAVEQLGGGPDGDTVGAGYTHAWLQAYLPGAGWVPFDPTNNLLGGTQLIRVGIARDPSQAAPISGSWFGESGDYLGMTVGVTVQRV